MKHQFELRHLTYFLAVAEEKHYRKAAEKLYISQPGLSRQIKKLEEFLEIKLFDRNNRNVRLTEAGKYLQKEIGILFNQLDNVIHHGQLIQQGLQGHLKIGYVGSAMQKIIPELLIIFRERHPGIKFHLQEMNNQVQIDRLYTGDIDIGFVRWATVPMGLSSHPVSKESFCLVLPADHQVSSDQIEDLSILENEAFILFDPEYSPSYWAQVMKIFDDLGFAPKVSHSTIHASSIFKLVANNFGISIVPQSLREPHHKDVKFVELRQIDHKTVLSAVWNDTSRNPILGSFVKQVLKWK